MEFRKKIRDMKKSLDELIPEGPGISLLNQERNGYKTSYLLTGGKAYLVNYRRDYR